MRELGSSATRPEVMARMTKHFARIYGLECSSLECTDASLTDIQVLETIS
jgi:hypothetical protein